MSDAYERLMILLATDDPRDPSVARDTEDNKIDEACGTGAFLMACLTEAGPYLAGAAIWHQLAADARRAGGCAAEADPLPDPWEATINEPESYPQRRFT